MPRDKQKKLRLWSQVTMTCSGLRDWIQIATPRQRLDLLLWNILNSRVLRFYLRLKREEECNQRLTHLTWISHLKEMWRMFRLRLLTRALESWNKKLIKRETIRTRSLEVFKKRTVMSLFLNKYWLTLLDRTWPTRCQKIHLSIRTSKKTMIKSFSISLSVLSS